MNLNVVPSGKNDFLLYYAINIRKGKKTTSKNVEKIGKLSELKKIYDDHIAHFKAEAKRLTLENGSVESFSIDSNIMIDSNKIRRISLG